ncbi:MAG: ADP-ribosyltransferase domain-containing protein [Pseudomonadota bacterium]
MTLFGSTIRNSFLGAGALMLAVMPGCKSAAPLSTTQTAITGEDGDVREVDLSTFVARTGECDIDGGYDMAASRNMRYSHTEFERIGNIQFPKNGDDTAEMKPFKEIVTDYERGVLIAYTGGLFSSLNPWLREKKDRIPENDRNYTDAQWSRMALCLASGINKLARYQGGFQRLVVYRGTQLDISLVAERYKKGSLITERGFQSYSFDKNVAISYTGVANGNDSGKAKVLFVVQGSGFVGASIEALSSFPEEKELLLNSDHKYCVMDVAQKPVSDFVSTHEKKDSKLTVISLLVGSDGCGG